MIGQKRRETGQSQRHLALEQAKQATAWRREQLCESKRGLRQDIQLTSMIRQQQSIGARETDSSVVVTNTPGLTESEMTKMTMII